MNMLFFPWEKNIVSIVSIVVNYPAVNEYLIFRMTTIETIETIASG